VAIFVIYSNANSIAMADLSKRKLRRTGAKRKNGRWELRKPEAAKCHPVLHAAVRLGKLQHFSRAILWRPVFVPLTQADRRTGGNIGILYRLYSAQGSAGIFLSGYQWRGSGSRSSEDPPSAPFPVKSLGDKHIISAKKGNVHFHMCQITLQKVS